MKVRKITKTESGGRLLNLRGFIPNDWLYVEVETLHSSDQAVRLELIPLRAEKVGTTISEEVSE